METTFKVSDPAKESKNSVGTAFLVAKVDTSSPTGGYWVIVTAAHVLRNLEGDFVTIHFRRKDAAGKFVRRPCTLQIRRRNKELFTSHPSADVAAFNIALPSDLVFERAINSNWIITDKNVIDIDLHPGDELLSLGYPLGEEANKEGFPILRSGKIASYPILPLGRYRLLFDFNVFGGNSGGPVYFSYQNRFGANPPRQIALVGPQKIDEKLVGLVSQQIESMAAGLPERLGLSLIVPGPFISQTLADLPGPETALACIAQQ